METSNPLLIAIDPGHGGDDAGASWNGRLEKEDNLRLGLALRDALTAQGAEVWMTREADLPVALPNRVEQAQQRKADLYLALHRAFDPTGEPAANGVENIIYLTAPDISTGRAAHSVLEQVVAAGVQASHGVTRGNQYILRRTKMPAMLLSMGYISNLGDNQLFDRNLLLYASAITRGLLAYFGVPYQETIPAAQPAIQTVPPPPIAPIPPVTNLPPKPVPIPIQPVSPPVVPMQVSVPATQPIRPASPPIVPMQASVHASPPAHPPPVAHQAPAPSANATAPRHSKAKTLVTSVQQVLNDIHQAGIAVDGDDGPETRQAVVRAFQQELNNKKNAGISVDGIFGPVTRALLPILRLGDRGGFVLLLQLLLALRGYDPGPFDSQFGSRTQQALSLFQRDRFLIPDGVAGSSSLSNLLQ